MMDAKGGPFQTLKRRIYLFVLPVISLTVILTFLMGRAQQYYSSFDIIVLPVLAVLFLLFAVLVYAKRPALAVVEQALYIVTAMVFLAKFAHSMLVFYTPPGSQSELTQTYVWAPIIYVLAFLIFEPRGALLRSLGVYVLTLVTSLAFLLTKGAGQPGPDRLLEFYLSSSIVVLLLTTFANLRQRVAQLQASLTQMHRLAHQDALTGAANRRQLEADLALEFSKAARYKQPLSLIMFDLDHFKKINDQYGHDAGDAVLRATAHLFKDFLRDSDRFGRWGGEEFLIVAPQTDLEAAMRLAERLRLFVAERDFEGAGRLTSSFGVSSVQAGDTSATVLKRADDALYLAKSFGRNRVEAVTKELVDVIRPPELYCPFAPLEAADADLLNRSTLEWLQGFQLVSREKAYRWVTAVNPGWLAAYVHRRAPLEARQLVSDWYMWMFLHDDRCDESPVGESPNRLAAINARLLEILQGHDLTPGDEPLARVLASLRDRLLAAGGSDWMALFSLRVQDYFEATVWEASNRAQQITPSLSTYLLKRLLTSGAPIDTALIEVADGVKLPLEAWEHPQVRYLTLVADNAVCWANDIFSLNKEVQKDDVHNLVLALQHAYKLSLPEAVARAGEMHDAEVRNFVKNERRLPSFGPEVDAHLAAYVDILRARMAGNIAWSRAAQRYQPSVPVRLQRPD